MRTKEQMTRQNKTHYARHKEMYLRAYRKRREIINRIKINPCTDCGVQYNPWVMQFDHRDPSQKKYNIGKNPRMRLEMILAEISKCDLVCANCHMERSHRQRLAKIFPTRGGNPS